MSDITFYYSNEDNNTTLNEFKNIHLFKDMISDKPFDYVTKYITRKIVLSHTTSFLQSIDNYVNGNKKLVQSRIFLSTYIITYFSDIVLNMQEDKHIYESAKVMLEHLDNFLNDITNDTFQLFIDSYSSYLDLYLPWKQQDRNRLIVNLAKDYWDLDVELKHKIEKYEDEEKREILSYCIKAEQQKIIEKVQELWGDEGLEYFNNLTPVVVNEKVYETFDTIIKKIFWENLEAELNKEPPNYLAIIPILKDVKMYIKKCVPNAKKVHKKLDESIDLEYLRQMIENDAISDAYVFGIVNYIMTTIKNLEAIEYDEQTDEWIKNTNDALKSGIKYSDFFPAFFKKVFLNLEFILEETIKYKKMIQNDKILEV
tara:strand:- start:2107 stop:3216 length:1110 start_codon:yes stop_codon:yes gene_type:complete